MATKKKIETKIDFSNSIEKIQATAKTVNEEVFTTAKDVFADIRENSEKVTKAAINTVQEAREQLTIDNGVQFAKKTVKNINDYALEATEEVVDATMKGGKQWQALADKAIKNGFEIAEKQQEIVFDTLDTVKAQLTASTKRFFGLFSKN